MSDAQLICELRRVQELAAAWDALAAINAAPESSPTWMLGWWRHVAPAGAELRVVTVHDHDELIGIVPLYVEPDGPRPGRYRLLADDLSGCTTPLALPNRAWEVAEAAARTLTISEPRPSVLELAPLPAVSPWAMALRECWPGRFRPIAYRADLADVPDRVAAPAILRRVDAGSQLALSQQPEPLPAAVRAGGRHRTDQHS